MTATSSEYGYTDKTRMEKRIEDLSTLHSDFDDDWIYLKISGAEKLVNGYCGTTFTITLPTEIGDQFSTKEMADINEATELITEKLMYREIIRKTSLTKEDVPINLDVLLDPDIKFLLNPYRDLEGDERRIYVIKHSR